MPSVSSVKSRLTIQIRKYSVADAVNSGRMVRSAAVAAETDFAEAIADTLLPRGISLSPYLNRDTMLQERSPEGMMHPPRNEPDAGQGVIVVLNAVSAVYATGCPAGPCRLRAATLSSADFA